MRFCVPAVKAKSIAVTEEFVDNGQEVVHVAFCPVLGLVYVNSSCWPDGWATRLESFFS